MTPEEFKGRRKASGHTQHTLARELELSVSIISKYECGAQAIPKTVAIALCSLWPAPRTFTGSTPRLASDVMAKAFERTAQDIEGLRDAFGNPFPEGHFAQAAAQNAQNFRSFTKDWFSDNCPDEELQKSIPGAIPRTCVHGTYKLSPEMRPKTDLPPVLICGKPAEHVRVAKFISGAYVIKITSQHKGFTGPYVAVPSEVWDNHFPCCETFKEALAFASKEN